MDEKKDEILGMTRRDFIKTTSVASMATLAAAVSASGGRCAGGPDTIRIGVIGCGVQDKAGDLTLARQPPGTNQLLIHHQPGDIQHAAAL